MDDKLMFFPNDAKQNFPYAVYNSYESIIYTKMPFSLILTEGGLWLFYWSLGPALEARNKAARFAYKAAKIILNDPF